MERVCLLDLFVVLILFPFAPQIVLRDYSLSFDRYLCDEMRIGEHQIETPKLYLVLRTVVPIYSRHEAVVGARATPAVADDRHVRVCHLREEGILVDPS